MRNRRPRIDDPTPAEIQLRTAQIRARWTEQTHRTRAGWTVEVMEELGKWTAPEIRMADLEFVLEP